MTRDEVFSLIRAHLADELEIDPDRVTESTRFKEDLVADSLDLYIAPMGEAALRHCGIFAPELRKEGITVEIGTDHKLKRMLELANKLNARYTLIVGDNEIVSRSYTLKDMASGEQQTLSREALIERLKAIGRSSN